MGEDVYGQEDGGEDPAGASQIGLQLERVLKSPEFEAPERTRRFLRFIVEETVQGRGARLKAYTIATQVFGREANFDPQHDPAVRIEAGRLRRALERYYLKVGQDDPLRITVPKGGYVPMFDIVGPSGNPPHGGSITEERSLLGSLGTGVSRYAVVAAALLLLAIGALAAVVSFEMFKPTQPASSRMAQPKLLVRSIADLTGSANSKLLARGLTDEIIGQLARFRELTVVTSPPAKTGADTLPPYALEGTLSEFGQSLRLSMRLLDGPTGRVIWTSTFDAEFDVGKVLAMEQEVARSVAGAIAPPYGVIFENEAAQSRSLPPEDWTAYACTLSYYSYRIELDPADHESLQGCLEKAVAAYPNYSTAWALLTITYLDEVRFHHGKGDPAEVSLARASRAADRAVEIDSRNVRALQAQMLVQFFQGDIRAALQTGAVGYALNPDDPEFAGEYGFRRALAGDWDAGCSMLLTRFNRSSSSSSYFESALALCYYMRGDYVLAEEWAGKSALKANATYHLILLAILGQLGKLDEAASERAWLEVNAVPFLKNIRSEVESRFMRVEDRQLFLAGLRKGGLVIETNPQSTSADN